MSNDAVLYSYTNVGMEIIPSNHNTLYSYVNIGTFAAWAWLGRVVGHAGKLLIGFQYSYANILAYVSGAGRITEDGNARITEDGNRRVTE